MDSNLLSWYQALQLAALGPCLFVLFFLCVTARNLKKIAVPVLYFSALSCSFLLPLTDALGIAASSIQGALLIGKSTIAALSFLLIIEFVTGNIPAWPYWAVLAIPLLGGSSLDYVHLLSKGEEVCLYGNICATPIIFRQLYEIFGSSLIFLLTIVLYRRLSHEQGENDQDKNKYAIVLSLIVLNLTVLAIKLAYVSGYVPQERAEIAASVVRMGFIYLVLTFVFRVFDSQMEIAYERMPTIVHVEPTEKDMQLAASITKLLSEEKTYRTMELNRGDFARKLAVTENTLSRVINMCFHQNFSTLINSYRIEEAKSRLTHETTPVTTIAFEVGFNSIPSFNRVFKQMTGVSPTEYRSNTASVAVTELAS